LIVVAEGVAIAGMLIGKEGILGFAIVMAGLGIDSIPYQVCSDRVVENPPRASA